MLEHANILISKGKSTPAHDGSIVNRFYVARQKMQGKNTQWESKEKKGKEKE